jgi:hypothetical protein
MEALAFRIWAYANPRDWNCSYAEIADETGISHDMVGKTIACKGWSGRVPHVNNERGGEIRAKRMETRHRSGQNVDPNLLAVDQLMR